MKKNETRSLSFPIQKSTLNMVLTFNISPETFKVLEEKNQRNTSLYISITRDFLYWTTVTLEIMSTSINGISRNYKMSVQQPSY